MATTGKKKLRILLVLVIVFCVVLGTSIVILGKYSNQIIKGELERRLGKNFSIERIDLTWGRVEAVGVRLKNAAGKEVIKVDNLVLKADFMGILKKKYIVSSMTLKAPYIFVEVDGKGNIVNPVLPLEIKPAKPVKTEKPEEPSPPMIVKKIEIIEGSVDYLDRKAPKTPVLTKLRTINLEVRTIEFPPTDTFSSYVLSAKIPGNSGTGSIRSSGRVNLTTKDMECKGEVRGLDMTNLRPYFQKDTSVTVTKGFIDLDINIKVAAKRIKAPGKAVLKDLYFGGGSSAGKFMGVPASLIMGFLKTSNNEIPVEFVVDGNLDNPKFNLQEQFMERLAMGVAGKLGFSIEELGQALLGAGAKGTGNIGLSTKGIEEGLKKIFKK